MTSRPLSEGKEPLEDDVEFQNASPVSGTAQHEVKAKIPFFRSTLFQILVVGSCAFCAPGVSGNIVAILMDPVERLNLYLQIWNAMNGLGVGGSQSPDLVNAANALLYAFMTITCFLGPWVCFSNIWFQSLNMANLDD